MDIKKVLLTVDYKGEDRARLESLFEGAELVYASHYDMKDVAEKVQGCDVAILGGDVNKAVLAGQDLKWCHCDHAGLNGTATPEVLSRGLLISSSAGRSAPVLAEHVIYFMLMSCYHTREMIKAQDEHSWGVDGMNTWYGLYGRTAGIIGMGNNGKQVAERLHAFGMDIISYDRNPLQGFDYISKKLTASEGDTLDYMYENADFIILCVALTDDTWHMLNADAFAKMKKGVTIVNMARGPVIDTAALIDAIKDGTVACAGLDTFETEPLPADDALWDLPQVYITPHNTPMVPSRAGRSLDIIAENVRRYRNDEKLLNVLDPKDKYTHGSVHKLTPEMRLKYAKMFGASEEEIEKIKKEMGNSQDVTF